MEIFIIKTDGTVDHFMFLDGDNAAKDYFKGYKVKDITGFECKEINEFSRSPIYQLLLEDGTTKKIEE